MIRRFAATLILCSSAGGIAAETSLTRLPWADRNDLVPSNTPMSTQPPADLPGFQLAPAQSSSWMEEATDRYREQSPQASVPLLDYDMQVFISTGIPDGALREMLNQALMEEPGRVRFVLRGFEPQQLGPLIGKIRKLFENIEEDRLVVEIDPEAFRTYQVEAVPVYLVREEGKWFEVQGMISLEGARENVRRRGPLVVGELYPIAEPDILSIIEQRAQDYDWSSALNRAQSRMTQNIAPTFDLPTVTQNHEEFFTPTFTVPHDIVIPAQGGQPEHVLAYGGQSFNVLDYTNLQVPIIVFDASDSRQVQMVQHWVRNRYSSADLFVLNADKSTDGTPSQISLAKQFGRPVYPWFGRMTDRFGVRAVPAIVEQSDKKLRISYVRPSFQKNNVP